MNDARLTRNGAAKHLSVSTGRVCGLGRKAPTYARSTVALRSQRADLNETGINRGDLELAVLSVGTATDAGRNACAAFMNTRLVKIEEIRAAGCLVGPILEMHGTLEAVCALEGTV